MEHALQQNLAAVYFISGDEPLQLGESADAVRKIAKQAGYSTREVFDVDARFNWNRFLQATKSLSLFGDQRVLDLRLWSGKPGNEGAKALISYTQDPPDDSVLLISSPKVAASVQKAKWFQALDHRGVIVQVWPLEGRQLIDWLKRRMIKKGLRSDAKGIALLASRVEGNLLAAAQEIDKIYILHGAGSIDAETIAELVADNSRFDVFKLMDSVLQGDVARTSKILFSLYKEGMAPPVVLWGLMKETRLLIQMTFQKEKGRSLESIMRENKIWEKRKPLMFKALERLSSDDLQRILKQGAQTDRIIKGIDKGDSWDALLTVCTGLCGTQMAMTR